MSQETPSREPPSSSSSEISDRPVRPALVPFADDATVVNLAGLSFENGTACIAVHGSLDLTRDRAGLTHAQTLRSLLDAIVTALEAVPDLPETVREAATQQTRTVANPFA